ncbi:MULTISPECIES: helix-turn-helix domain-containing protein [Sphingobacteriaceae]|uniref:Transcriptional regulator n=3 Tax=Sphingobacteriaceae TaxID=84566 RepID=A0A081PHJ1_9SPHI|nr:MULTISPECIES: helix-turn-helix transcriptional regulator [Sphingobacteriaceae]KEQ30164.1 transcriptional regulator [Pedobacter antarcticus 4BY]MBA8986317.1 transcriptional regulator with XRE-family HTH domain [Sphingobacterium soli]WGQ12806.1 helix-turn-helix transcriptional regulator [Sphingobacterium faecium]SFE50284.1 Helix-turn-helix domain-containing protein [Pedobacter antarcticus]GGE19226.1 transcriptional regulator [Sphingobacterium soli]
MKEEDRVHVLETVEENHQGRNAQRIRIYLGIKQEVLAQELGMNQPQISAIEREAVIEPEILERIAFALGVTPDLIKKFDVERAIYNINSYKDVNGSTFNSGNTGTVNATQINNPLEKVVELYERLLQSEREKLELFINHKNQS